MTTNKPFGTLTPISEEAACCGDDCCGDAGSSEITHEKLETITAAVQHQYGSLASNAAERAADSTRVKATDKFYSEDQRDSLPDEAAGASAGCGNPVRIADAQLGETVLDLGSGGGVDCFLAANEVGPDGYVIGIDVTPRMLELAQKNAENLGTENVVFKLGHIESIPQADNTVDLVISNCVIALSEQKDRVFSEIYRILKPGGRFVISDMVTSEALPDDVQKSAVEWVACVGGAAVISEYLELVESSGFSAIEIVKEERNCPDSIGWEQRLINLTLRASKPNS